RAGLGRAVAAAARPGAGRVRADGPGDGPGRRAAPLRPPGRRVDRPRAGGPRPRPRPALGVLRPPRPAAGRGGLPVPRVRAGVPRVRAGGLSRPRQRRGEDTPRPTRRGGRMPTTVDYSGASVTVPGYTVTLSGVAADRDRLALTVTVDHDFPVPNTENRRVGNAMLWIDGKLAAQLWGPACPGQSFTYDAPGPTGCRVTISITIDRAAVDIIPGGRELVLSLWPQSAPAQTPIPYLRVTLDVPARPRPVLAAGRFTRALFWTDPNEVLSDPALAAAIVAAGVTHLTCGVFTNPADSGNPSEDYATWRSSWLPWITGRLTLLQQHSLRLHAAGDDFLRSPAERPWLNSPDWAPQPVEDVATVLRVSGVCDALAAVDEINGAPTDDPAYARFVQAWRSVPGAPPLGWPAPGAASPPYPFEVPAYADYADRYWSDLDFRPGRGDSSITTASLAAELARVGSQVGCPPFAWTCLVSAMGALYTKQAA